MINYYIVGCVLQVLADSLVWLIIVPTGYYKKNGEIVSFPMTYLLVYYLVNNLWTWFLKFLKDKVNHYWQGSVVGTMLLLQFSIDIFSFGTIASEWLNYGRFMPIISYYIIRFLWLNCMMILPLFSGKPPSQNGQVAQNAQVSQYKQVASQAAKQAIRGARADRAARAASDAQAAQDARDAAPAVAPAGAPAAAAAAVAPAAGGTAAPAVAQAAAAAAAQAAAPAVGGAAAPAAAPVAGKVPKKVVFGKKAAPDPKTSIMDAIKNGVKLNKASQVQNETVDGLCGVLRSSSVLQSAIAKRRDHIDSNENDEDSDNGW